MMTELRPIAHPGKAAGADRFEIAFVEGEVGPAVAAIGALIFARRAARRTTDHRRVMAERLSDGHGRSTVAAEPAADRSAGGVELAFALRTSDEQAHDI